MHSIAQNISNYRSNGWHSNRSNSSNSLAHRTCMSLHLRDQILYFQLVIRCFAIRTVHDGRHTISDCSTVRYDWTFGKRKTTAKTRTTMHDGNVFRLYTTTFETWVYMKVFQIWPDAVVLECGCKWTTAICRYSSRVGRYSRKHIRQLWLLYAVHYGEWGKSKNWDHWTMIYGGFMVRNAQIIFFFTMIDTIV